jgi:hypothetical protein
VRQFAGYYRRPRPVDEVIELAEREEAADRRNVEISTDDPTHDLLALTWWRPATAPVAWTV